MASPPADLYGTAYGNFAESVLGQVRHETYGEDFGQSSWVTGVEYRQFIARLELTARDHVLDVGCGSGGPAVFLAREAGCSVTGVDVNQAGLAAGRELVRQAKLEDRVTLRLADVKNPLPLADHSCDAIVCLDAMCHLPDRRRLFGEWRRVLRPGGRFLYTDPVVVTGLVSKEEFAIRSSTGYFEFAPLGVNEWLLEESGLELAAAWDATKNEAEISLRWHDARERHAAALMRLEGAETFTALQRFLRVVHALTSQRRMTRMVFLGVNAG
jgi:SAM-dependent methyltransferase